MPKSKPKPRQIPFRNPDTEAQDHYRDQAATRGLEPARHKPRMSKAALNAWVGFIKGNE